MHNYCDSVSSEVEVLKRPHLHSSADAVESCVNYLPYKNDRRDFLVSQWGHAGLAECRLRLF